MKCKLSFPKQVRTLRWPTISQKFLVHTRIHSLVAGNQRIAYSNNHEGTQLWGLAQTFKLMKRPYTVRNNAKCSFAKRKQIEQPPSLYVSASSKQKSEATNRVVRQTTGTLRSTAFCIATKKCGNRWACLLSPGQHNRTSTDTSARCSHARVARASNVLQQNARRKFCYETKPAKAWITSKKYVVGCLRRFRQTWTPVCRQRTAAGPAIFSCQNNNLRKLTTLRFDKKYLHYFGVGVRFNSAFVLFCYTDGSSKETTRRHSPRRSAFVIATRLGASGDFLHQRRRWRRRYLRADFLARSCRSASRRNRVASRKRNMKKAITSQAQAWGCASCDEQQMKMRRTTAMISWKQGDHFRMMQQRRLSSGH